MVDFSALKDPAVRAEMTRRRLADEQQIRDKGVQLNGAIEFCIEHENLLTKNESTFVRSLRHRTAIFGTMSDAQEKWLMDIKARLDGAQEQPTRFAMLRAAQRP